MTAYGYRTIQRDQPAIGAPLADAIPRPWVNLRALGRNHVTTGINPISSSNYIGHSARNTPWGRGIRIDGSAGSGISHTFADFPERQRYAVAVLFNVEVGGDQTIFGINGSDNGIQVRINTSGQIDLLAEAAALLATSTFAGFTAGTTHSIVVIADGSTYIYANGKHILTYAGVVDNKLSVKFLTLGCRGGGTNNVLTGTIIEATMWSGTLPSRSLGMEISRDYYGTMFPRRRSALSRIAAAAGITGPLIGRGRLLNSPLIGGRLAQ